MVQKLGRRRDCQKTVLSRQPEPTVTWHLGSDARRIELLTQGEKPTA